MAINAGGVGVTQASERVQWPRALEM